MNSNESEKLQPKRPFYKKVFTFLKWLFIIILALLLTIGLIFQAPWKVLVLLAILFFTLTLIPKRARKYIWLSLALIILILIVWIFLPEDDTGWRPYTIDDEIAAFNAKYTVPDEQNAAVIYNQLFESYDGNIFVFPDLGEDVAKSEPNLEELFDMWKQAAPKNTFYPDSWTKQLNNLTLTQAWSSQDYPELAEWLKEKHGCTIELLIQAAEKEGYYQPLKSDKFLFINLDMQSAMADWFRLLIRAANNDRADGRLEKAAEKYMASIKMAELIAQNPSYCLLGFINLGQTLSWMNSFIVTSDLKDENLLKIETVLKDINLDWDFYWQRLVDKQNIENKNIMVQGIYEINEKGKIRFSRGILARQLLTHFNVNKPLSYTDSIYSKIIAITSWFYVPSKPEKMLNIIDQVYEKYYQDFDWTKEPDYFSFRTIKLDFRFMVQISVWMIEPSFYKIHDDFYPRALAHKRTSQLIIALKQYKNKHSAWPNNLNEIKDYTDDVIFTDPFNDGSFVYKLTNDSFMLYSKGTNGIDDAGVKDRDTGADDILIWPEELPESEENDKNAQQKNTDSTTQR